MTAMTASLVSKKAIFEVRRRQNSPLRKESGGNQRNGCLSLIHVDQFSTWYFADEILLQMGKHGNLREREKGEKRFT